MAHLFFKKKKIFFIRRTHTGFFAWICNNETTVPKKIAGIFLMQPSKNLPRNSWQNSQMDQKNMRTNDRETKTVKQSRKTQTQKIAKSKKKIFFVKKKKKDIVLLFPLFQNDYKYLNIEWLNYSSNCSWNFHKGLLLLFTFFLFIFFFCFLVLVTLNNWGNRF